MSPFLLRRSPLALPDGAVIEAASVAIQVERRFHALHERREAGVIAIEDRGRIFGDKTRLTQRVMKLN